MKDAAKSSKVKKFVRKEYLIIIINELEFYKIYTFNDLMS